MAVQGRILTGLFGGHKGRGEALESRSNVEQP